MISPDDGHSPNYKSSVTILPRIPVPASSSELNLVSWPSPNSSVKIMGAADWLGKRGLLFRFKDEPTNQAKEKYQHLITELHEFKIDGDDNSFRAQFFVHLELETDETILCSFIDSITASIASIDNFTQDSFFGIFNHVLDEWSDLLRRFNESKITKSQIIGLIGELVTLDELLSLEKAKIGMWTGPENDRFDFKLGPSNIEVKSSSKTDKKVISVHGVDQLDGSSSDYLIFVQLEISPGGFCLQDLVNGIDNKLTENDRDMFGKKLAMIGYSGKSIESWNSLSFSFYSFSMYRLGRDFPSLKFSDFVGGILPSNVSSIQYLLDLSSTPPERSGRLFADLGIVEYV